MLIHKVLDCVQVAIGTGQREWGVTCLVQCTCTQIRHYKVYIFKMNIEPQTPMLYHQSKWIFVSHALTITQYACIVTLSQTNKEVELSRCERRNISDPETISYLTFWIEVHSFHKTLDPVQPAIECTH